MPSRPASPVEPTPTIARMAPTKPMFGGVFDASKADSPVWIGGKPNATLDDVLVAHPATPLCTRGLDPASEMKGYPKRVGGSEIKFKRDDPEFPLTAFAHEALSHMEAHGMDSVFHMTGGVDGEELFTYHTKYTKSQVDKLIKDRMPKFDQHAVTALKESAVWLVNSLDESLKSALRLQLMAKPTGPQVWMMIVMKVQSDSLRRSQDLAEKFKALTLAQFKGENVTEYVTTAGQLLLQLDRDDQLPKDHLLTIVDALSACSILDFKVQFMGRRTAVEQFIRETAGKTPSAVQAMPDRITYEVLLEEAERAFNNLKHVWGTPAKAGPENAMVAQLKAMTAKLNKVEQQLKLKDAAGGDKGKGGGSPGSDNGGGGKGKRKCFKCGSEDHLAKDCPKPKGKDPGKQRLPPPKNGEPHTKEVNGKTLMWCSKCWKGKGSWNRSHLTKDHDDDFKSKKKAAGDNSDGGGAAGNLSQTINPSLWMQD